MKLGYYCIVEGKCFARRMQLTIAPLLGVLEEPIQAFLPACLSVRLLRRNVRSVNAPDTDEFQGQQPAG